MANTVDAMMMIIIILTIMLYMTRSLLVPLKLSSTKVPKNLVNVQDYIKRASSLRMSLEMEVVKIPRQSDLTEYWKLLSNTLPNVNIIRWYIARFENGTAVREVVYDRKN